MQNRAKKIIVTPGEPAGIGPDLIIQLAQLQLAADIVVIADKNMLSARASKLGLPLKLIPYQQGTFTKKHPGELSIIHIACPEPDVINIPSRKNANYIIDSIKLAVTKCLTKEFSAYVTGPVNKAILNDAGIPFQGHTDFLAQLTQSEHVVMMFTSNKLYLALATAHLPLSKVPQAITKKDLTQTLTILEEALKVKFKIRQPCIAVCGLNPHAGEDGYLGTEEIEIINPVLESLRTKGLNLIGPLPADTVFLEKHLVQCDCVLAMYHDQGLPVLKYQSFDHAVNITLGLPFLRTSVDHGTALELAGTGKANPSSLLHAIKMAIDLG